MGRHQGYQKVHDLGCPMAQHLSKYLKFVISLVDDYALVVSIQPFKMDVGILPERQVLFQDRQNIALHQLVICALCHLQTLLHQIERLMNIRRNTNSNIKTVLGRSEGTRKGMKLGTLDGITDGMSLGMSDGTALGIPGRNIYGMSEVHQQV